MRDPAPTRLSILGVALAATLGAATLGSAAAAAGPPPDPPAGRAHPSGIFSHGDAGDFVEDAYARPPEREPPEDAARRKRDPGVSGEMPATRR